jgi:uncharacterized protein
MRIVIDTNQLLTCFSVKSTTHWLWQAYKSKAFDLCVTTEILNEYAEIFERKYSFEAAELVNEIILESLNTVLITEYYHWNLITIDPDDNKFVDCALMANADFIITHDKHFKVLREIPFPSVKVISLSKFKEILSL